MKAIALQPSDQGVHLIWRQAPDPVCGPEEVLVAVKATAVNRADLLQAQGLYPAPPGDSEILGLEAAGEIEAVGEKVIAWGPGDRVCALVPGGGYATRVAIPEAWLIPLPAHWSYVEGAAIPEVWLTAETNLFQEGAMQAGETVLIHAGASGVGTAAIQLAREMGARVAATAGTAAKLAICRELGAEIVVDYKTECFREVIRVRTGGEGVDLVLDCIGGPYLADHILLLKPHGRLINIGLLGGHKAEIDLAGVLMKSLTLKGTRMRARSTGEKGRVTTRFRDRFWPLLVAGKLRPVVDRVFPITEAEAAHAHVKANRNIGKVILDVAAHID
jgi:putative PIG3 family NAD(P)H quinone oxidoreductase